MYLPAAIDVLFHDISFQNQAESTAVEVTASTCRSVLFRLWAGCSFVNLTLGHHVERSCCFNDEVGQCVTIGYQMDSLDCIEID